jgi:nucleoside-diphosphate-sugar epimerase
VTRAVVKHWGAEDDRIVVEREDNAAEAGLLTLDPSLARKDLAWEPAWTLDESIEESVRFYRDPTIGALQIAEHMAITSTHAF